MKPTYYDNLPPTPHPDHEGMVEVERVYCIDEDAFQGWEWDSIGNIYQSLPGEMRSAPGMCPMWFGLSLIHI